jgi:hypothetical protein
MNEEKRPGGLTALAVFNFIFSGLNLIGLLGWIVILFVIIGIIPTEQMNEIQKTQMGAFENLGIPMFIFILVLSIVSGILLLLSGIGYLKQKKVMGRLLGNLYAIINIISSIISGILIDDPEIGGGFNLMTIAGLIYPVLTLILINTTFKDDLTN